MYPKLGIYWGAALVAFCAPSAVLAQSSSALNLCASTADTTGIVAALAPQGVTADVLRKLVGQKIGLHLISSGYEITHDNSIVTSTSRAPATGDLRPRPCSSLGKGMVVLSNTTIVPGEIFAAYGAAASFRKSFVWPRGAVNLDDLRSEVYFTQFEMFTK